MRNIAKSRLPTIYIYMYKRNKTVFLAHASRCVLWSITDDTPTLLKMRLGITRTNTEQAYFYVITSWPIVRRKFGNTLITESIQHWNTSQWSKMYLSRRWLAIFRVIIWGLSRHKQVYHVWISNCIQQNTVECSHLSMPEIPASDTKVLICFKRINDSYTNISHKICFNSLGHSDDIWWLGSRSTLVQVMACCLTAPSHY